MSIAPCAAAKKTIAAGAAIEERRNRKMALFSSIAAIFLLRRPAIEDGAPQLKRFYTVPKVCSYQKLENDPTRIFSLFMKDSHCQQSQYNTIFHFIDQGLIWKQKQISLKKGHFFDNYCFLKF